MQKPYKSTGKTGETIKEGMTLMEVWHHADEKAFFGELKIGEVTFWQWDRLHSRWGVLRPSAVVRLLDVERGWK